jgi:hypothetical protein
MLTAITLFTLAGGAVLGSRYKVLILAPAFLFVLVAVIGAGVARGAGIWAIALEMFIATTALQLGYAGGSALAVSVRKRNTRLGSRSDSAAAIGEVACPNLLRAWPRTEADRRAWSIRRIDRAEY